MTLVQGSLSVFLILIMAWYHGRIEKSRVAKNRSKAKTN